MRATFTAFIMLATCLTSAVTAEDQQSARIRPLWSVTEGLFEPESVAIDEERDTIYVSNTVGYGLNGQGHIGRMSMSGRMVNTHWVVGLNGPTGMALRGTDLYVADVNLLKVIDVTMGLVTAQYGSEDTNPCLDDVAIADDGTVFVSGGCSDTIYKLEGGALKPFIHDPDALRHVNGLFVSGDILLSGGWQIRLWNRQTGEALADGPITRQPDVKDINGLAWDGSAFLMSMVDDTRLWRLGADGVAQPVPGTGDIRAADFFYDDATGLLIVPQTFGDKDYRVSAYRLTFE